MPFPLSSCWLTWALSFRLSCRKTPSWEVSTCRLSADRGTFPWVVATAFEQTLIPSLWGLFYCHCTEKACQGRRVHNAKQQAPACRSRER